jgi:hypothetical protein
MNSARSRKITVKPTWKTRHEEQDLENKTWKTRPEKQDLENRTATTKTPLSRRKAAF